MTERTVVVLAPMVSELRPVVKELGLTKRAGSDPPVYEGALAGWSITATLAGVGPARAKDATERVLRDGPVDRVVVVGIAGGVNPDLNIGDVLSPAIIVDGATGREWRPAPFGGAAQHGRIITTDGLSSTPELLAAGVTAADMESSAVAEVCEAHGVAWSVIRVISDRVQDGLVDEDVAALAKPDGSPDIPAALRYIARNPGRIGALRRLARDAKVATTGAARQLAISLRADNP